MQTCSNFALTCSKKSICWPTLKFGKISHFGKGDTPYAIPWVLHNGYTPLEQCLMMVFAPDESSEAVLRLEMLSNVETTGYEKPPPSLERVNLMREMRSRQQSLLEFISDSPGPSGSGSTPKSPWPVFL